MTWRGRWINRWPNPTRDAKKATDSAAHPSRRGVGGFLMSEQYLEDEQELGGSGEAIQREEAD